MRRVEKGFTAWKAVSPRRRAGDALQFDPHGAELKSVTKTRTVANDPSNTDCPARGSESDFHQLAGLHDDASVEFHARAAQFGNQSRHNQVCGARDGNGDRGVRTISEVSASVGPVHRRSNLKHNLFEQAKVQQVCRSGQTNHEHANQFRYLEPPRRRLVLLRRSSA